MNAVPPHSRKRWLWLVVVLAAVLLGVFWVFIKKSGDAESPTPAEQAQPRPSLTVTVAQPTRSKLPIRLQANGNITAWQEASVGAEVNGLRLASVNVNVGDVVRKVGLSRRTLQRQLSGLGLSFADLLRDTRQRRAIALLRGTECTITEIAARLGYGDPAHFSRAFERWSGMAPSRWRELASA